MIPPSSTTPHRSAGRAARSAAAVGALSIALVAAQALPARAAAILDLRHTIGVHADGALVPLGARTYEVHDFDARLMGGDLRHDGLRGAGVHETLIEMTPHTSTKASNVPTTPYATNQLYLLSTLGGTPGLSGFRLKATDQGHLYNGLRVGRAVNARVHDVTIQNVPGSASSPPGETFMLNDYRTTGSVYDELRIQGAGVAAAGFGMNSSTDVTVNRTWVTGTRYSSGFTIWQTNGVTLNDVTIAGNRSGINFERSSGSFVLNRPTFTGNRLYDLQIGTDGASARVTIVDPVLAAGQRLVLRVPASYHGGPNGQRRSDIHVLVHGVDRTSSLVTFE